MVWQQGFITVLYCAVYAVGIGVGWFLAWRHYR